jgi:hypothetical protein
MICGLLEYQTTCPAELVTVADGSQLPAGTQQAVFETLVTVPVMVTVAPGA